MNEMKISVSFQSGISVHPLSNKRVKLKDLLSRGHHRSALVLNP